MGRGGGEVGSEPSAQPERQRAWPSREEAGESATAPFSTSYREGRWSSGGSQEGLCGLALSLEGHSEGAGGGPS